jgi:hypothetical protein
MYPAVFPGIVWRLRSSKSCSPRASTEPRLKRERGVAVASSVLMIGNQLYDASRVDAAGTDVTVVVDVAVAVFVSVVVIADGVTVMVERVVIKS